MQVNKWILIICVENLLLSRTTDINEQVNLWDVEYF